MARPRRGGFTLIEIMIVVGIIGMILAMGAPTLYHMFRRKGMSRAVAETVDLCTQARARAILTGKKTRLIFFPHERRIELEGGAAPGAIRMSGSTSADMVLPDNIVLEALRISMGKYDLSNEEAVWVWFYPDGTCDEMELVLSSDRNEWRIFSLEAATAMVTVDADPNKLRR